MQTQFLFRPRFYRPNFELRPIKQSAEVMAVLRSWNTISTRPEAIEETDLPDFEDFHENAIRYHYALESGIPVHVLDRKNGVEESYNKERWRFLGSSCQCDGKEENSANQYHLLKSFLEHAGRRIELVNFTEDNDPKCPKNVIGRMRADGVNSFRGKVMSQAKYTHETYIAEPEDSNGHIAGALFGYAPAHFEGDKDAAIIQEVIDMEYEYRCIFVDGKIVTGAGCIKEFTPYNRLGFNEPFDPQLRRSQADETEVIVDHDRTNVLVNFAQHVLEQMVQEQPALSEGTIDVAMTPDGKPLVIELNGAPQYGLYGCNAKLIIEAHAKSIGFHHELAGTLS